MRPNSLSSAKSAIGVTRLKFQRLNTLVVDRVLEFRKQWIDKKRFWLFLLIGVLYVAAVGPHWQISNDSGLYLLLAQSLANGDGYTLFGQPHGFVPPGFPMMLSVPLRLGLDSYLCLNLGMAVIAIGAIYFAYSYLRLLSGQRMALLATGLFALGIVMHRQSGQLLSDVPFTCAVCFGLLCYARALKGHWIWVAVGFVAFVASCWIRVVGIPIAAAAYIGLLIQMDRPRRRGVLLAGVVLVAATSVTAVAFTQKWQAVREAGIAPATYAPNIERMLERSISDWLLSPLWNIYETGPQLGRLMLGDQVPALLSLGLIAGPILLGMRVHLRRRWYLGVVVTLGYLGAVLMLRSLVSRYLLPVAPLLSLYFIEGWRRLFAWTTPSARLAITRTLVLISVMLAIHLVKDVRHIARVHHPQFPVNEPEAADLRHAAGVLNRVAQTNSKFLGTRRAAPISHLCEVPYLDVNYAMLSYEPPRTELLNFLERHGVDLLVLDVGSTYKLFMQLQALADEGNVFESVESNEHFAVYRRRTAPRAASMARPLWHSRGPQTFK